MKRIKNLFVFNSFICTMFLLLSTSIVSAEQQVSSKLDTYVENFLTEQNILGAAIAIVHENDIMYSNSWGITGETEKNVTLETPFTIGSISKSLTGLAVMKLMEDNSIRLDAPIQKYIPSFTLKDKEAASKITIKHLLTQTSGISTYTGLSISDQESKGPGAILENVKALSNAELTAKPGEKHQYSNANFLILGALIEAVTNQTYAEYMEQHVFAPLGMQYAAANHEVAYEKGYAAGYQSWFGVPRKSEVTYDDGGAPYGYITASATDMVQYIKFLSGYDESNFLTEENRGLYTTPHVQTGENRYYGLGVRISNPNSKDEMIWHSGSTPDSRAEVFYIPEKGYGGIILTNKSHILEEEALIHLKQGIINVLYGEEPVEIPKYNPIVQFIMVGVICLLVAICMYLLVKMKSRKVRRKILWRVFAFLCLLLSIATIPLFIYSTGSPWHTIQVFAPDIALLSICIVTLLAVTGLLSVYTSFKTYREKEFKM
ncbi:serine hydrolase domain-containing protein [Bacillus manliponensis]|uniref:serine hydrolase domain-containing protein n=1 Tax=Bacillus manliponensis TaxID=574376 RepID=UPI003517647F